ncbi:MAG TPA: hypothetical protein VFW29_03480 [Solirubrobacteraceae bacterium]|nr:hypothetical protein [Solirubrobacteraceae bacterium]
MAAAAAILLTVSAPALGAVLSAHQAAKVAAAYGQSVRKQLHASSVTVGACRRLSAGRTGCRAEARFTGGARRCTFEVIVSAPSAKGQQPRTEATKFVCY